MSIPRGPINLNTYIQLAGFVIVLASGLIGGGWAMSEVRNALALHEVDINRIEARTSALEASVRVLDRHELRLSNVETQARDAAAAMRTVEAALNSLASDIRVTREIVQRIENAQRGGRLPQDQR